MRDKNRKKEPKKASSNEENAKNEADRKKRGSAPDNAPNPPRTTTGRFTAPKFGSAGSGGAELEPGPKRP